MKLVFIHGLGGQEIFRPVEETGKTTGLRIERIAYRDITDKVGWTRSVVDHVRKQLPSGPHVLMGHSFGASLALHLQGENTLGIVLLSPFFSLHIPVRLVMLSEILRHGKYRFEGESAVEVDREDFNNIVKIVSSIPKPNSPSLTVLGSKDKVVDLTMVRRWFSGLEGKRHWLIELSGTGHNFVGREEDVAMSVSAFLKASGILSYADK